MADELYWADQIAKKVIKQRGRKSKYVCAAGITPSGTVHIGNFREVITVELVSRALKSAGKKVRFIYSWDDYDRLRKVPKNFPKQNLLKKFLGQPIVDVPDPFECHKSYAEHLEKEFENELPKVGIKPKFIYQNKMYRACKYAKEIAVCLQAREKIREILNKYRKEPLPKNWYPVKIFCRKCNTDETKVISYDGKFTLTYKCKCGAEETIDFRKSGNVKLVWRVDWPMRWHYEKVDFEPGGKDHSTPGGSRDTGSQIIRAVYHEEPPVYQMYDFVIVKGAGGKISSSLGNVITLTDCLKIYLPEIVRYLFASTKPNKEFSIPTDEEVIKTYEDFYKAERIFYGKEPNISKRNKQHWSRVYEMSCVSSPAKEMPEQPSFRHAIELINIYRTVEKALPALGKSKRNKAILECAKNWLELYAPEQYKFEIQEKPKVKLIKKEKEIVYAVAEKIKQAKSENEVKQGIKEVSEKFQIKLPKLFVILYKVLLNKERGPRFAPLVIAIGQKKVAEILKKV